MTPASTSVGTEPAAASISPATAPRMLGLRIVLHLIGIMEALDGFTSASTLFGDMSEIPGPGFGGFLIKAHLATHPVLAIAVIALAVTGRVRGAIIALSAIVIMTWLNVMPSVVLHGLDFNGTSAFETPLRIVAFPLMAACAIAYAARNQRLGLATALAALPTLFQWLGIVVFAIGVMIYGF